ncbi:MAG TPA: hypothetical protein VFT70_13950 [Nocardioides sp.]|nr:hypothetical protein [Nocardioides sp.]
MRRLGIAAVVTALLLATPAAAQAQIEDYASYDPSSTCHEEPKAGTAYLARWVVKRYGGSLVSMSRDCHRRATSEHQNGRAFDWALDAHSRADRQRARAFLGRIFATDKRGHSDAWARRMGVMYVIWNDRMYPAWTGFEPEPYLSSSCRTRKKCSPTLRHRDHVHVSLSRQGSRGVTSWYDDRT